MPQVCFLSPDQRNCPFYANNRQNPYKSNPCQQSFIKDDDYYTVHDGPVSGCNGVSFTKPDGACYLLPPLTRSQVEDLKVNAYDILPFSSGTNGTCWTKNDWSKL